jgi:phage terminase large subunit
VALPFPFDWRNPDYIQVFDWRLERLNRIRDAQAKDPTTLSKLFQYYRLNPVQFIIDWGCTVDPRNAMMGKPVVMPFLMFPKQEDFAYWILERWKNQEPGAAPKSRDMGVSWVALALSATLCQFNNDLVIGFGSRKLELVDKLGDPDSLFWKVREFMSLLPPEFRRGWTRKDAPEKVIKFPGTNSVMKGEGGDEIGRGGRTSLYFVDESAFLERPQTVEASLSNTTNCRIDLSSFQGTNNPFYTKTQTYKPEWLFPFHWRDDPRKDEEWYQRMTERFDAVTMAQEVDMNPNASVTGIVIPSAWVQAAIDAHTKLGIAPSGKRTGALDVADEGIDLNAFCGAHGILVEYVEGWSGKGDDIYGTVERAFEICDDQGYDSFDYDGDGLGAGVRGDARVINIGRKRKLTVNSFRGSGEVVDPDKPIPSAIPDLKRDRLERTNKDFFANRKAQAWWSLRVRFQATYRAVIEGKDYDKDSIISLSPHMPELSKLVVELSQPTYTENKAGKIVVDKAPEGTKSPNLADSVMIRFAPVAKAARGFFTMENTNA